MLATGEDVDQISGELEQLEREHEGDTLEAEQDVAIHHLLMATSPVDEAIGTGVENLSPLASKGKEKEIVVDKPSSDEGEVKIDQLVDEEPVIPLSCQVTIHVPQNNITPAPPHPVLKTLSKTQALRIWAILLLIWLICSQGPKH
jgi:hypothetical protein